MNKTHAEPQPKIAPATTTPQPIMPEKQLGPARAVQRAWPRSRRHMEGTDHKLDLTISDPPGLTMQSSVREPLLKKIDRARKDVKKNASLSPDEKASRLDALDKIEASAKGVQLAAARVAKNPAFITPQVPGFDELAKLISAYEGSHRTRRADGSADLERYAVRSRPAIAASRRRPAGREWSRPRAGGRRDCLGRSRHWRTLVSRNYGRASLDCSVSASWLSYDRHDESTILAKEPLFREDMRHNA